MPWNPRRFSSALPGAGGGDSVGDYSPGRPLSGRSLVSRSGVPAYVSFLQQPNVAPEPSYKGPLLITLIGSLLVGCLVSLLTIRYNRRMRRALDVPSPEERAVKGKTRLLKVRSPDGTKRELRVLVQRSGGPLVTTISPLGEAGEQTPLSSSAEQKVYMDMLSGCPCNKKGQVLPRSVMGFPPPTLLLGPSNRPLLDSTNNLIVVVPLTDSDGQYIVMPDGSPTFVDANRNILAADGATLDADAKNALVRKVSTHHPPQ
eukprot:GHVT01004691.1.p1 GENE.GHVT01004691.1~~GHVT01004691.1.p1  ORF type:complete len:259 (+),score=28.95 GHVT01004691.1:483-1259(+)